MVTVVSSILSFKHSVAFMPDHYERTRKCGSLVENYFRKDTENSPAEGGGPAEECEFHSVSSVTQIATAISAELTGPAGRRQTKDEGGRVKDENTLASDHPSSFVGRRGVSWHEFMKLRETND